MKEVNKRDWAFIGIPPLGVLTREKSGIGHRASRQTNHKLLRMQSPACFPGGVLYSTGSPMRGCTRDLFGKDKFTLKGVPEARMGTGRDLRGFDFLCKGIPRSFLWGGGGGGVRVITASGGLHPRALGFFRRATEEGFDLLGRAKAVSFDPPRYPLVIAD